MIIDGQGMKIWCDEGSGNGIVSTTLSWFVVKNARIPCNGAPTRNRKSSSEVENQSISNIFLSINDTQIQHSALPKAICKYIYIYNETIKLIYY